MAKSDSGHHNPPAFLSAPRKSITKLAPLGDGGSDGGPAQLLRNEITTLTEENSRLRERIKDLETRTTSLLSQKEANKSITGK